MQNYPDLVLRFKNLKQRLQNKEKRKYVTRKEIIILANDMTEFVKEEHPEEEKRTFWPLGYLENIFFLLDESNPEKSFKFADDK